MSYGCVEIRPGPGFNVVIGPNGSGKSSIVSAMTLGLGGDVRTLGRQKCLAEFVNNTGGAKDKVASIEVELAREGKKTYVVGTKITRAGRRGTITYTVDGKASNNSEVTTLASRLQIQTDNLCQFLPQDVVREFPQMPPSKVLTSTIRYCKM
jgi:chromosome segregation ATPase